MRPFSLKKPLDRRVVGGLVGSRERDHDVAVVRVLLAADDDEVALEDPRVDHRIALDAKQELLASARERLGHRDVFLDVLLGQQRAAGGDLAQKR